MDDEDKTTTATTGAEAQPEDVVVVPFPTCPSCGGQTLDNEYLSLKTLICCLCGWTDSAKRAPLR